MNITYSIKIGYAHSDQGFSGELNISHRGKYRKLYFTVLSSETERVFTFFFKRDQKNRYFSKKIEHNNIRFFIEPAKTLKTFLIQLIDDSCEALDSVRHGPFIEKISDGFTASWGPSEIEMDFLKGHEIKMLNFLRTKPCPQNSTSQ